MPIDPEKFKIDPKKASQKDLEEAFALLQKKRYHEARVKAGEIKGTSSRSWGDMTPEQKEKARKYNYRRMVRQKLLVAKAIAAGITVSDKEVDAEIAKRTTS